MGLLGGLLYNSNEKKTSLRDELERSNNLKEQELDFRQKEYDDEERRYHEDVDRILQEWEDEDSERILQEWEEEDKENEREEILIERSEKFYYKAKDLFMGTFYTGETGDMTRAEKIKNNLGVNAFEDDVLSLDYYIGQIDIPILSKKYNNEIIEILEINIEKMYKGVILGKSFFKI